LEPADSNTGLGFRKRSLTPPPPRVKGFLLLFLMAVLFIFHGCTAILSARAAVSASTGTSFYINGELQTDYYAPIDRVWKACEKTARDMRARDLYVDKEYRDGTIEATINGNNVHISITYKQKDITNVGIRVGTLGDESSSQFLHDLVEENLKTAMKDNS
jgi:hypothetical protein